MIPAEFRRFPHHWDVLPFLKVFKDATSGNTKIKKEDFLLEGSLPIVDQGQSHYGGYTNDIDSAVNSELPSIVFGDHTRAFKFIEEPFALGADGAKLLEPIVDADKKYLFYYLKQLRLESAGYSRHFKFLKETYIPLPPLEVQKQIAAVLEKADTLRSQCQQMEQELNTLAQSVFLDMFGDPVTNPHNFTIKKISELVIKGDKVNYGVVQPGDNYEGGAPLIRISDFENEKIVLNKLKYISPEIDKKHKKSKLRGNEVLIACVGATIGKLALASEENKGMNIARAVVRISPNDEITPYYLLNYLKSTAAQRHFLKETRAVGQPTLNVGLIASCPVLIPPKDLQQRFQSTCENISKEIVRVKELYRQHELAFNSLMQRAFKGELQRKDVA